MPREDVKAASVLDWACGGRSLLRCVNPITGYTKNDLDPLAAGIRPWNNWRWEQMASFCEALGGVKHVLPGAFIPFDEIREKFDPSDTPDWPLYRVHGHGAGGWYPFYALDGRLHGPNRRRILVENTRGPFSVYHAHLQYSCGRAEMEIANAHNIAVYGVKNETMSTIFRVSGSENVLLIGFGGPGVPSAAGKFAVQGSRNVTLVNLINDFKERGRKFSLVRAETANGTVFESGPDELPALFKITDPNFPRR
jgi:hypothetical protein